MVSSQPGEMVAQPTTMNKQKIKLEQLQSTKLSTNNESFEAATNVLNHSMNAQ